jgi:hypothetical protein
MGCLPGSHRAVSAVADAILYEGYPGRSGREAARRCARKPTLGCLLSVTKGTRRGSGIYTERNWLSG